MRSRNPLPRVVGLIIAFVPLFLPGCAPAQPPAPAAAQQTQWTTPFFFVTLTDPQLGFFTENNDMATETELLTRAIHALNRLKPAFVVVTGDLIHKPADKAQTTEFLRIVGGLDPAIPIHFLPGNHDLENVPTPQTIDYYRKHFGPDYYSFDFRGCHFIALNTTLLHSPDKASLHEAEQWVWLKNDLEQSSKNHPKHTILFQHHPTYLKNGDEPNDYHTIPNPRRAELLQLYRQHNVSAVFAGHLHRCNAATHRNTQIFAAGPVGKPLGKDPSGLAIVKVYADRVEYEYFGLDQVPANVSLQ